MSNMINHVFQFYVGMLLNWDLFFADVFDSGSIPSSKVLAQLDLYFFYGQYFIPFVKIVNWSSLR